MLMNKFFKLLAFVGVLSLVFGLTAAAKPSYPEPTTEFFVNDFAGCLTSQDETEIFNKAENLYNACKAQVVVVTVDSLDGYEIEDYSIGLAREWGIGDKDKDSGILLLLSVNDREVRIEVGSGLEGALPDSKTGRILDTYGMEYFRNDDFSAGLTAVQDSLVNEVFIEYGLEPDADYEPISDEEDLPIATAVIFLIIFVFIIIRVLGARQRGGFYGTHHGGFGGFGGFHGGSGGSSGGFRGGGGGFSGGGSSRGF